MLRALLILPIVLTACAGDETISGFVDTGATYQLAEIDGAPFGAAATISFPETGLVRGQAPCNAYSAEQTAPYPWFALGSIRATRATCADAPAEAMFFDTLAAMSQIEVSGDVMILRDDGGREMIFTSVPVPGK
jgi:heat shock protein HslJ